MGTTSAERRNTLLWLAFFLAMAFGWLGYLLYHADALPKLSSERYDVRAVIPTSSNLTTSSRVVMAGVEVGRVVGVEQADLGARVDLQITDKSVTPLPADSRVALRQRTAIGENYISITPGRSDRDLASGGTLPIENAEEYVDVDQVLSALRGKTRQRARQTIKGLGGALVDRGDDLNRTLGAVNDFAPHGNRIVKLLHRDRVVASRLVEQLGDIAGSIGQRGTAIDTIASRGLVGMRALASRDAALAESLNELPETLTDVRSIVDTIGTVSDRAVPTGRELVAAVRELRPTLEQLPSGTRAGREVLQAAAAASPNLRGLLDTATETSQVLPQALPPLRKTFCEINPIAKYIMPYFPEALYILIGLGSSSNTYDATGHLIRLEVLLGANASSGRPDAVLEAEQMLLNEGLVGKLAGSALTYDFYMEPGSLGTDKAVVGGPIGPEEVDDTGYKYPRIKAEC